MALRDWEAEALALIDTCFTGELIIPANSLPQDVGLPDGFIDFTVADDREVPAALFVGQLELKGLSPLANVAIGVLGSEYIVGLGIIRRYHVILERGQRVIVQP